MGGNDAAPQKFSVGAVLREAREQQGLSVADVANRIKFAPRQIEAMEADDYAQLPEATFVRGFVRSYARLLEVDAAPLLAALPQTHVQQAAPAPEKKAIEVPFPSVLAARQANIMWFAGALLVALLLFILSRMHDSVTTTSTQPVVQSNVETQELALPTASAPVADAMTAQVAAVAPTQAGPAAGPAAVAVPAKAAQTVQPTGKSAAEKSAKEMSPVQKQGGDKALAESKAAAQPVKLKKPAQELVGPPLPMAQKPAVAASAVSAAGQAVADGQQVAVRMSFDEESWVDVKDGTGRLMLSRLNRAGSLVRMSGVAPISISIGHAKGVHVYYKGKEINLAPHTNGEKARLVLE